MTLVITDRSALKFSFTSTSPNFDDLRPGRDDQAAGERTTSKDRADSYSLTSTTGPFDTIETVLSSLAKAELRRSAERRCISSQFVPGLRQ